MDRKSQLLSRIIGRIYDAALDDGLWALLAEEMAALFDAPSAILHIRNSKGEARLLYSTENAHPTDPGLQEQGPYWRQRDLYVQKAQQAGSGRVLSNNDLFHSRELEETGFYQDWCRHLGIYHIVGSLIELSDGNCATIAAHRPQSDRPFVDEQRELMTLLLPHLGKALEIRRRLQLSMLEREASLQAVQQSNTAVLVVAPDRRILYASGEAEAILREGIGLGSAGGRLYANSASDNGALQRCIAAAACLSGEFPRLKPISDAWPERAALSIARLGRLPLTLFIAPFRPVASNVDFPAGLVLLRDPERATPQVAALRELFGFTLAEAAISLELVQGNSPEGIAQSQGVSLNTIRTHLKRAFGKTNTSRQAEFVAMVLRSMAVFGGNAG